ncbi:hypothetical protein J4E91_010589 [Alternaria rosae]|nr:hypothetical protein J4E91_010589 [Alternaria rosae]
MSNYHHVLFQFPPLIATIILALIFRKIFYKYLNTARKRSYALRVVAINIGIIFLLYVVVVNVMMVADMRRRHEMEMNDSEDEYSEDKERVQSNPCVRTEVEMNEHEEEENLAEEGSVLEEVA